MSDLRTAARHALEALEDLGMRYYEITGEVLHKEAYTALRAALEQETINYFVVQRIANERGLDYNKFAAALRDFAAAEREECAKLCDPYMHG